MYLMVLFCSLNPCGDWKGSLQLFGLFYNLNTRSDVVSSNFYIRVFKSWLLNLFVRRSASAFFNLTYHLALKYPLKSLNTYYSIIMLSLCHLNRLVVHEPQVENLLLEVIWFYLEKNEPSFTIAFYRVVYSETNLQRRHICIKWVRQGVQVHSPFFISYSESRLM